MGLRYLSSDSSGMKSNLRQSLSQGKQTVQDLKSGSQQLVNAIDGKTLSGAAYTAGKGLFSDLIIPAINNVSKALDNVETDLTKYESQEHIVSGESLLDEDSLLMERQIKRTLMEAAKAQANVYKATAKGVEHVPILDAGAGMFKSMAKQMDNVAKSYQDEIDKINKKITKLHHFSEGTRGLFENSLKELKSAMKSVTSLNDAVVDGKTGNYTIPNKNDISISKSTTVFTGAGYSKLTNSSTKGGKDNFRAKYVNGQINSISANLKNGSTTGSAAFSKDGQLSGDMGIKIKKRIYTTGVNVGFSQIGIHQGIGDGKKTSDNTYGLKINSNFGISGYLIQTQSTTNNGVTVSSSAESGKEFVSGKLIAVVGIAAAAAGIAMLIPADMFGVGEVGQGALLSLIGSLFLVLEK